MLDTVPFNMHCYSLDWHPADHVSFSDNAHLRKIAPTSKVQVNHKANIISYLIHISLVCLSYLLHIYSNDHSPLFLQNPSACQTYDVVTFEAHDSIPRMDQIMWPRHCVQVRPFFCLTICSAAGINWSDRNLHCCRHKGKKSVLN